MYCPPPNETPFYANPLSQLSQLTIQIHTTAVDLAGYETLFGTDTIGFIVDGSESMMSALQDVLRTSAPESALGERETRHDFRNKLAVVKGFGDLLKMDLPESHSAVPLLHRLTERCSRFSAILDSFKAVSVPTAFRMAG